MPQETEGINLARDTLQAGVTAVVKDSAKGAYHVAEVRLIAVLVLHCHRSLQAARCSAAAWQSGSSAADHL